MTKRVELMYQLEDIHKSILIKIYRLGRQAQKRGLYNLSSNIREEAHRLESNISYQRFWESYKYSYIYFE